jgi:phage-related protein
MDTPLKPLHWVGSSKDDLRACPEDVKDEIGYALHIAQEGGIHSSVKPLLGFGGASVLEVVSNCEGNAYRGVYTVRFAEAIYVLHVFMKKSKKGRKTPQSEIELVKRRLKTAEEHHAREYRSRP